MITPFLMFEGQAEAAMNFYVSLFPGAEINEVVRFGPGESGTEGSILKGIFTVAGQTLRCFDSAMHHEFTFTPAFSLFVDCASEEEIERLAAALGEGGSVLMPLDNYGFSRRFTWVNDRYGMSWQLNLE